LAGWRRAYGLATLAVGVALLGRLLLAPWIHEASPFLLFTLAVMVSGAYGGLGPGLYATLLSAAVGTWLILRQLERWC
jgi:K+-sensing histidine kinase KdpD